MNLMSSVRHMQQQYNTEEKKTNERVIQQTHIRIKIETHEEEKKNAVPVPMHVEMDRFIHSIYK